MYILRPLTPMAVRFQWPRGQATYRKGNLGRGPFRTVVSRRHPDAKESAMSYLPAPFKKFIGRYPEISRMYEELALACHEAGPWKAAPLLKRCATPCCWPSPLQDSQR